MKAPLGGPMIALSKLRICLVEDDPLIRDAAEMGLSDGA